MAGADDVCISHERNPARLIAGLDPGAVPGSSTIGASRLGAPVGGLKQDRQADKRPRRVPARYHRYRFDVSKCKKY